MGTLRRAKSLQVPRFITCNAYSYSYVFYFVLTLRVPQAASQSAKPLKFESQDSRLKTGKVRLIFTYFLLSYYCSPRQKR